MAKRGSVHAKDWTRASTFLAALLPLSDRHGCLLAFDSSPETAGLLGVPTFCGDHGELSRREHRAPPVTEAQESSSEWSA
jgi:hypothetical protein